MLSLLVTYIKEPFPNPERSFVCKDLSTTPESGNEPTEISHLEGTQWVIKNEAEVRNGEGGARGNWDP